MSEATWRNEPNVVLDKQVSGDLFSDGGKLYATASDMHPSPCRMVYSYDAETDAAVRLPDIDTQFQYTSNVVSNGKLYQLHGMGNQFLIYDVAAGVTSAGADQVFTPRRDYRPVVLNGKIYVIGGATSTGQYLNDMHFYDIATGTWSQGASMKQVRKWAAIVVANEKIYVFGGQPNGQSGLKTAEVYDPATDSWANVQDFPVTLCKAAAAAYKGKIYLCGGDSWNTPPGAQLNLVHIYDIASDSYSYGPPLPVGRRSGGAAILNGRLYVAYGQVKVHADPSYATSLQLDEDDEPDEGELRVLLKTGKKAQLSVSHLLSDNARYIWISTDDSIVSVDTNGLTAGEGAGLADVSASDSNGFNESIPFEVEDIDLSPKLALHLQPSQDQQCKFGNSEAIWSSADNTIASVDQRGLVTGQASGLTDIKAENDDSSGTLPVRVE